MNQWGRVQKTVLFQITSPQRSNRNLNWWEYLGFGLRYGLDFSSQNVCRHLMSNSYSLYWLFKGFDLCCGMSAYQCLNTTFWIWFIVCSFWLTLTKWCRFSDLCKDMRVLDYCDESFPKIICCLELLLGPDSESRLCAAWCVSKWWIWGG